MLRISIILLIILVLAGCASGPSTKAPVVSVPPPPAYSLHISPTDTLETAELENMLGDSLINDSTSDEITSQLLERARQHYQNALDAEDAHDSTQAAVEFESAIGILNALGYYPDIENNQDFNDLSHSVVEDYEKYIANIDSLGSQTSIFALRNKLNQIDESNDTVDQDTPQRVITTTQVPMVINGHVQQNIRFFQERGRIHFEHWLYLSGKYFPMMKREFRKAGIPEELVYLSMIESGLNPGARSWAKAVGLWQFIKGTGSLYNLSGNFWYDERRDYLKATRAAARHLKDLYSEFGDWYLALAAYNSGPGRVSSAIRRSHSSDFWKMRPHLPRETRNYVPQYIAAAVMTMNPAEYGFSVTPADTLSYEYVKVPDCVSLTKLAVCAGTDVETLRELNPELLQWCTPPGMQDYQLRIPVGRSESFAVAYAKIPDDQKRDWIVHKVRRRETLASIAHFYGITPSILAEANHLKGRRLPAGKSLVIPVPGASEKVIASIADDDVRPSGRKHRYLAAAAGSTGKSKIVHRIRKGDSLGRIAALYGVRISDLRRWNEIPYGKSILAGNKLIVWTKGTRQEKDSDLASDERPAPALKAKKAPVVKDAPGDPVQKQQFYVVKEGDNLDRIARRSGVTTADLMKWNRISGGTIHPGQKLSLRRTPSPADVQQVAAVTKVTAQRDTQSSTQKPISYTVKRGDTLQSIASLFGVTISKIRSWNKLHGSRIVAGQALIINS